MTDPTGRSFLSYSRRRSADAELLIQAQHDLGIPTWQDVKNLGEGQTETELEAAIADDQMACAILWLTPEVADSAMIREVEVPAILRRLKARGSFFLVPVAAGGLDYAEAAKLLENRFGLHDLGAWNLQKVQSSPLHREDAAKIAQRILRSRLAAVHESLPAGEPLLIRCMARQAPGFVSGYALSLDWSRHFKGTRHTTQKAWRDSLLPTLRKMREALREDAPGRKLEMSGRPTLSAAAALGCTFLSLDEFSVSWRQVTEGRPDQLWSVEANRESAGFEVDEVPSKVGSRHLAVLLSVTETAEAAFEISKGLPQFRVVIHLRPPLVSGRFLRFDASSPALASDIAMMTIEEIRKARVEYRPHRVHLFMAVPAGLAMLLGQLLNTLGSVQLYEHDDSTATGRYRRSVLLKAGI